MTKAFTGPDADARYERSGMFLLASVFGKTEARDWLDKRGLGLRKAQGEGIGTAGAFLVPTELANAILDIRDAFGAFRRRALIWPMGSDSSVFTRRTGGTAAAFIGEGTAVGGATPTFDSVGLTAKKLGAQITVSSELDEDSLFDLVDYVANEMAVALASKEDDCGFNGDGTSAYGGIRGCTVLAGDGNHAKAKVTAASGHNTYATLDSTDLGNLVGAVRSSALTRAAWFVSAVGFGNTLARLTGASGYLDTQIVDGVPTRCFNGFPIVVTDKFPQVTSSVTTQAMMAFGDMRSAAVLGQRRGLTIKRSAERYLDSDQVAILGTERFDAVVHDMGDNTNAGSIAVLVAP